MDNTPFHPSSNDFDKEVNFNDIHYNTQAYLETPYTTSKLSHAYKIVYKII